MANLLKQQRDELLRQALNENPNLENGKRFCGIIALIWVLVRALDLSIEIILAITVDPVFFVPANIIALGVVIAFALGIYNGGKAYAILPIVGGGVMLLQVFLTGIYELLGSEYLLGARIYALAFILTAVVQLVLPIVLLTKSECKQYFNTVTAINKQLTQKK